MAPTLGGGHGQLAVRRGRGADADRVQLRLLQQLQPVTVGDGPVACRRALPSLGARVGHGGDGDAGQAMVLLQVTLADAQPDDSHPNVHPILL